MSEIIPFGKYKGQPLEAIADDRQYVEWLLAQAWFQQRHQHLYQVIINNFAEPSESPEHNAMQARFLDAEFRLRFALRVVPDLERYTIAGEAVAQAVASWHRRLTQQYLANDRVEELKSITIALGDEQGLPLLRTALPEFEVGGVDVRFEIEAGLHISAKVDCRKTDYWVAVETEPVFSDFIKAVRFNIEIKPSVGDDYPAVIRQMRQNKCRCLLLREYTGRGVSHEIFVELMKSQGFFVIFESDVDAQPLFPVEKFQKENFLALVRQKISEMENS